ncbi:MAG: enoyl-CoA hydratase-related protein, partial [Beijerinckiaceae bacterium]
MSDTVLTARQAGVTEITLNRPDRLNSFTVEMHGALSAALEAAAADADCRAVLLTGAGRGFCAGQDLSDRAVAPGKEKRDLGESLQERYNPLVRRMRAMPKPIVVAVNGVAAGAGANIALHG